MVTIATSGRQRACAKPVPNSLFDHAIVRLSVSVPYEIVIAFGII